MCLQDLQIKPHLPLIIHTFRFKDILVNRNLSHESHTNPTRTCGFTIFAFEIKGIPGPTGVEMKFHGVKGIPGPTTEEH